MQCCFRKGVCRVHLFLNRPLNTLLPPHSYSRQAKQWHSRRYVHTVASTDLLHVPAACLVSSQQRMWRQLHLFGSTGSLTQAIRDRIYEDSFALSLPASRAL